MIREKLEGLSDLHVLPITRPPVNSADSKREVTLGTLKEYVQAGGGGGGIPEAPADGKTYGRKDGDWAEAAPATHASTHAPDGSDPLTGYIKTRESLRAGLVAYWPLSDLSDATGNGFTLANNDGGGGAVSFVPGKFGNCANFDGTNFLSCFGTLDPSNWTEYTFAGWIKAEDPGEGTAVLVGGAWKTNAYQFIFMAHDPVETVKAWTGMDLVNSEYLIATGDIGVFDDEWHHFASVFSAGKQRLFIDGVLVAEALWPSPKVVSPPNEETPAFALGIAGGVTEGNRGLVGKLDEVGVWNCALTAADVAALYSNGDGLPLYP